MSSINRSPNHNIKSLDRLYVYYDSTIVKDCYTMEICSNTIDEKHEEIEDSLEDLQIFPTRKGLRRSFAMIKAYFVFEETIMRQIGFRDEDYQSTMEDQRHILNNAVKDLNKRTQVAAANESC